MFSGDLRHFPPPFLFPYSNSFSPVCELFNPILRLVRMVLVYVRITLFEWCVTVKGMVFWIGLLATRLPISECFRGASIGFASHKTAGSTGESRTIQRANWRHETRKRKREEEQRNSEQSVRCRRKSIAWLCEYDRRIERDNSKLKRQK